MTAGFTVSGFEACGNKTGVIDRRYSTMRHIMTSWQRWISQPQTVWLRKALFQLHLWTGIGVGIYVFVISITGTIVVYRNELYRAATRDPIIVSESGPLLTDDALKAAAGRVYPGYKVGDFTRPQNPREAISITLDRQGARKDRLFDPYTGADLGDTVPFGIHAVGKLLELHDDLLGGPTGRRVNGVGGILVMLLAITGIVVWWPGIRSWRRSLVIHRNAGWRRFTWDLHSMIGFWTLAFIVLFGLSGVYLAYPETFQSIADRLQPPTPNDLGDRLVDQIIYWLAYLHFGRINGIGIPCRGPGLCDQSVKLIWALAGLAPAAMVVTGAVMWWNRVLRKRFRRSVPAPDLVETP